jgi:RNA polymerase sigma-70 factor (ECF subfamily)
MHEHIAQEPSDELLMARYADGEASAFDDLFRRYERRAYAFFLRRTASPERAQDLYQELFLRIHRARDRYDRSRPFAPWLFQIAQRLLVDDLRRAHRSREVELDREPLSQRAGAEQQVVERELLDEALAGLSPEERHVLVSSKLEGTGYPELAVQLGKTAAAVRKTASRALQRVRATELRGSALSLCR